MSLRENFEQIAEALQERKSVRKAINKINTTNNKARSDEMLVNSVVAGLISVYYSVKDQATQTNVELNGFIIEPNNLTDSRIGDIHDPRLLIEMAQKDPHFNSLFTVTKRNSDIGHEQYVIQEKQSIV